MLDLAGLVSPEGKASMMPTPRSVVLEDGSARLLRFSPPRGVTPAAATGAAPVLLVPSMINRWYVLDLRPGASVVDALVRAGLDVWCLDWGSPGDHDRWFTWQDGVERIERMLRRIMRVTGAPRATVLGYCMGATLSAVHAALHPERYAGFVNLLGPIDFSEGGILAHMTDPRWFDPTAIAGAGNVSPDQMQSAFQLMRPSQNMGKLVGLVDRGHDPEFRAAFAALETWANDNVAFPAAAYETYIADLYQKNRLIAGEHVVGGQRVELSAIACPVLTVIADKDAICPPRAATALNDHVGSADKRVLSVAGGHVGAVVGKKAADRLYPALAGWMKERKA